VTATVELFIDEYGRRFTERDVEAVTDLALWPFLAIQRGERIHLPDREALRDHYASEIKAYQLTGAVTWTPVEIEHRELGAHSVYVSVRWNVGYAHGDLLRDTCTSYQFFATQDGWRMLSYTNHF
jgi:hypothetical protein